MAWYEAHGTDCVWFIILSLLWVCSTHYINDFECTTLLGDSSMRNGGPADHQHCAPPGTMMAWKILKDQIICNSARLCVTHTEKNHISRKVQTICPLLTWVLCEMMCPYRHNIWPFMSRPIDYYACCLSACWEYIWYLYFMRCCCCCRPVIITSL